MSWDYLNIKVDNGDHPSRNLHDLPCLDPLDMAGSVHSFAIFIQLVTSVFVFTHRCQRKLVIQT